MPPLGPEPVERCLDRVPLASCDKDRASELVKRLVGQRTSSHGGKYVVRRKGLLDEVPHVRLIRGVILLRTVELAPEGRRALRVRSVY